MTLKIGFTATHSENKPQTAEYSAPRQTTPKKSVVQVFFAARNRTLAYYNDQFDLHPGDIVFVDGKLEGLRGQVTEVCYNFKIRLTDYKRVIAVADTEVKGRFFTAGSHFVTFDPTALPPEKAVTWFKAPDGEDEEFVCGSDDTAFRLDDLKTMKADIGVMERGHEYYAENRVRYLCLNGGRGYAIVEGREGYEAEFAYDDGEIRSLTCSCFCGGVCKHGFAAMLQLRETLERIETHYAEEYAKNGFFAAVDRGTLLSFVLDSKETAGFTL